MQTSVGEWEEIKMSFEKGRNIKDEASILRGHAQKEGFCVGEGRQVYYMVRPCKQ